MASRIASTHLSSILLLVWTMPKFDCRFYHNGISWRFCASRTPRCVELVQSCPDKLTWVIVGWVFEMNQVERLSTVRGFLLDMDGTFYLSDRLLEGALRFIDLLRAQNKDFLFLTNNSSKHRGQYAEKITRLGLPLPEEYVLTSGEAT